MTHDALIARIQRHEGYSETPYRDHLGVFTIGWGTNIERMSVPSYHATIGDFLDWLCRLDTHEKWFDKRFAAAQREAKTFAGDAWEGLSETRQGVLIELAYQLGFPRLSGFKRFRAALQRGHWVSAEHELLDSDYANQVPERARRLAAMMLEG